MTANTIRSFAVGLLVSAVVCAVVYFSGPNETEGKQTDKIAEKETASAHGQNGSVLTDEEMKDMLTSKGYVVLTKEENEENIKNAGKKTKTADADKTKQSASEKPAKKETVNKTVLTVTSGMTGIDVRNSLVEAKIITDGQAFTDALKRSGREFDLRPGTYEVSSDLSLNELITAIYGTE